jgi:hypothetical protein
MADRAYKGVVSDVYEKDWTDRDSGDEIILRSFQIEGEKLYFRTGTTNLKEVAVGNYISFTASQPGNNVDFKTIEVVEGEAPVRAPKPAANRKSAGSQSSGGRDSYWADKAERDVTITEPRISYSAAQKNATAIVCVAMEQDLLSFGNAAKGKRLDMLVDYVAQVTEELAALQMAAPEIMKESINDGS